MADRVNFTPRSAQRIADAVLKVEAGDRSNRGVMFGSPGTQEKVFRVCTFTGAWTIGSSKEVTFRNNTTPPNTVTAYNLYWPITKEPEGDTDCAIGKDGTAWYLISVPLATAAFVSGTATTACVTDITFSATLNTNSCEITIDKSSTMSTITVLDTSTTTSVLILGF